MDINTALVHFMEFIGEDPRMGPSHISLFLAILYFYREQDYFIPIRIYRRDLKKQARISGASTYHKCLKDLVETGCIKYNPSNNPLKGSLIYLALL